MNAFLAVCLAAVFSAWVYILKQELAYMEENLLTPEGSPPPPREPAHPQQRHAAETIRRPMRAVATPKNRNADGVPVWTIEC